MKFILLVTAAVLVAGGGTFLLTGQQPVASSASLAGDWRCNTSAQAEAGVPDSNMLLSIAADGATKGRTLLNAPMQGHTVTLEATFKGDTRVLNGQLHETTTDVAITEASVDGQQAPPDLRAKLRKDLFAVTATYNVREFGQSRLVYANEDVRVTCQRSPVPLDL
jgi:hypothetical protein